MYKLGGNMEDRLFNHKMIEYLDNDKDIDIFDAEDFFELTRKETEDLFKFVILFYNDLHFQITHDEITLSNFEFYILTYINDNPGTVITDIAKTWYRTTSSASQMVSKFVSMDLVIRERNKKDGKVYNLYTTDLGSQIAEKHKKTHIEDARLAMKAVLEEVSYEDVEIFFKVLDFFSCFMENVESNEKF